jgi:hypothetical protein
MISILDMLLCSMHHASCRHARQAKTNLMAAAGNTCMQSRTRVRRAALCHAFGLFSLSLLQTVCVFANCIFPFAASVFFLLAAKSCANPTKDMLMCGGLQGVNG